MILIYIENILEYIKTNNKMIQYNSLQYYITICNTKAHTSIQTFVIPLLYLS